MVKALKFNVEKKGFPVQIGDVELWVNAAMDSAYETASKFQERSELAQKQLNKYRTEIDGYDEDEKMKKSIDFVKTFAKEQYDALFGVGTYDKLNDSIQDPLQLLQLFPTIATAVAERLQAYIEKETKTMNQQVSKAEAAKRRKKALIEKHQDTINTIVPNPEG